MSLAPYVRILGRGPGRARPLTREEAREAMTLILNGEAGPEAIGALLMLLRYRGETTAEVAGFVEAARARIAPWRGVGVALDWPSYAAGRTRGHPYFLLAARLVARAGYPVLLHGFNSHQQGIASVRAALGPLGIPVCPDPQSARAALAGPGIAYVPLDALDPRFLALLRLRDVLGLRSIVNTVLRLLDPGGAGASVQGVFHPSYRTLQTEVGLALGQSRQAVIKGGGGEFERNPAKAVTMARIADGAGHDLSAPPLLDETRRLSGDPATMPTLAALWAGTAGDPFAEAIVTGTAALALATLDPALTVEAAEPRARALWTTRDPASLAA